MADRFPLIVNSTDQQIQELASGDKLDLTGSGITADVFTVDTNSSERLRIDSSGNVDVNTNSLTTSGALLQPQGGVYSVRSDGSSAFVFSGGTANGSTYTPKVLLNADGSASFDGAVQVGGDPNQGTAIGVKAYQDGSFATNQTIGTNKSIMVFNGGTNPTAFIQANGTAKFSKYVECGDSSYTYRAILAFNNDPSGTIFSQNYSTNGAVFEGASTAGNSTSYIYENGSATFASSQTLGSASSPATNGYTAHIDNTEASTAACFAANNQNAHGINFLGVDGGNGNAITCKIMNDGSATFAGDVAIGGHVGNHTVNGIWLESSGDIRVTGSSSNTIWAGYLNGTAAATSKITADGSADFAGDGIFRSTLTITGSTGNGLYVGDSGEILLKKDGSADFDGEVKVGDDNVRLTPSGSIIAGNSPSDIRVNISGADGSARFGQALTSGSGVNLYPVGQQSIRRDTAGNALEVLSGGGTSSSITASIQSNGSASFAGAVSKGSGSFRIDHPLKPETHQLVHSFVEGPQADNIYRGKVELVDGTATVNIDTVAGMTEGTFAALNREIQCFTTNETGWTAIKGSVTGNLLTIVAQDNTCTDTISWLVIGERQDQHMYDTEWTDENGKVIVEPEKEVETESETE